MLYRQFATQEEIDKEYDAEKSVPDFQPYAEFCINESEKARDGACGGARRVYRVDAAGWTDVTRAGATDVPGRPVLAEAASAQMDHAAGAHVGRRS